MGIDRHGAGRTRDRAVRGGRGDDAVSLIHDLSRRTVAAAERHNSGTTDSASAAAPAAARIAGRSATAISPATADHRSQETKCESERENTLHDGSFERERKRAKALIGRVSVGEGWGVDRRGDTSEMFLCRCANGPTVGWTFFKDSSSLVKRKPTLPPWGELEFGKKSQSKSAIPARFTGTQLPGFNPTSPIFSGLPRLFSAPRYGAAR